MTQLKIIMKIITIGILGAVVLSACGAAAPAEPTQDPNMIFTQVAETVMVSMTQTSEAMPPTPIPEPTATIQPPTLEPAPTMGFATQPTQGNFPAIPTPTMQKYGDSAQWTSNNPSDGTTFSRGERFNLTACFINNGATDWTTSYYLEWVSGFKLWPDTNIFYVGETTEPGEKWCFTLPCVAPTEPGEYITRWYFKNADGDFMQEDYFPFKISN